MLYEVITYRRSIEIEPRNTKALYGLAVLYTFELEDHESYNFV